MEKVLLVEDAKFYGSIIVKKLEKDMGLDPHWVTNLADAREALEDSDDYALALLDLTLPDAQGTEIVELVTSHLIPSIVFSSTYDRETRDKVMQLGVIDYIIKESSASVNYLFATITRVLLNRSRSVLVVEDSAPIRKHIVDVLERFQLNVVAVSDGAEALDAFEELDEVSLVVTDYEMPNVNGLELTKALQHRLHERKFAIIGISAVQDTDVRIQFIKAGAADFLTKPFEIEELFCRISQNLNFLDQVEMLEKQANNDFLTGLYNRRHFFDSGESKLAQAQRSGEICAVMLLDIDNFKPVNDTYGHDSGDRVLVGVADRLSSATRQADVLARFGGEEFCKLLVAPQIESLPTIASRILHAIGDTPFGILEGDIPITTSVGIAYSSESTLDQLIEAADRLLYEAKRDGRNRACIAHINHIDTAEVVNGPEGIEKPYLKARVWIS